jgi:beta-glucosidase
VGVVVVGETPYAEGVGDVGNNHTLQLSLADRAAVDRVCAAVRCVVLTVSGRPLDITGIVPRAAGVVASWLPGSEGAGVADVLFGDRPFAGRLPVSWFTSESQLPVNVGDRWYDPLYAYGWGLRTDSGRARLQALRARLDAVRGDADVVAAVRALDRALAPGLWRADGTAREADPVLSALHDAAGSLQRSGRDAFGYDDPLVSVARDIVQAAVAEAGPAGMPLTAQLTSDAEHDLLSGRPQLAVHRLIQAYHRVD